MLPFALKSVLASIVVDAGSVNSVVSALTAAWLTVGGVGTASRISMLSVMLCIPFLPSFASITMAQAVLDRVAGAVIVRVPDDILTTGFEARQADAKASCLKVKVSPPGSVK